ncbi:hypothetical protein A0130_08210 [Leifsonia xyli]|uniref:hypothetical protein n=1 Tax=Leifsonia xyli TaxID=1575 RepID=UPI0007CDDDF8|nr:hypothetical protein A0130_08210 [Leifsonia xyli]
MGGDLDRAASGCSRMYARSDRSTIDSPSFSRRTRAVPRRPMVVSSRWTRAMEAVRASRVMVRV